MPSSVGPLLPLASLLGQARALDLPPYVLGATLAQGGMAVLYHGQRTGRSGFVKRVVLKRLRPELRDHRDAEALFLREASLGARLEHPAIVRVYDLTELSGVPYLVMEYIHGGDLRLVLRRLRRRGRRLAVAAALYLGRELCSALDYTHSLTAEDGSPLGLVHRDVSPTNILLSVEGEVKLGDFGIAQTQAAEWAGGTARGQIGYMSPEQARGEAVDARSDLFSLATVLYELCTGQRLFIGEVGQSPSEVYATPPVPPSRTGSGLPAALDRVLLPALALSPSERPPTAAAFYHDLLLLTQRCQLWMDRPSFAAHLLEVCGQDPADWATVEERTNTALIATELEAALLPNSASDNDSDSASASYEDRSGGPAEPSSPPLTLPLPKTTLTVDEQSESGITVPWPVVPGADLPTAGLTEPYQREDPLPGEVTLPLAKLSGPRQVPFQTGSFRVLPPARAWLRRDRLLGVAVGLLLSTLLWLLLGLSSAWQK